MASENFSCVQIAPPIEVFALTAACNEDNHPDKVNLSVGGETGIFTKIAVLTQARHIYRVT